MELSKAVSQIEISKQQLQPQCFKNLETLPEPIKKVIQVKYASKPFAKLSELEREAHSAALLIKINVVTGWPMPESDEERNILSEQLKLYLVENWENYNVDEIMFAIRAYATVINNWGKNMNLSLIGKALTDYQNERIEASKFEESKIMLPEPAAKEANWKELCQTYYQDFLNGKLNFDLMPWPLYDEFHRAGMISADAYEDYLPDARQYLLTKFINYREMSESANERFDWEQKIESLKSGHEEERIIEVAKKMSVKLLYRLAKKKGIKSIL